MPKKSLLRLFSNKETDRGKVADLLKLRPHHANNFDKAGNYLLHRAIEKQDYELVRLLLDCGADPNTRNNMGYTPLHFAVIFKDHRIVHLLLKNNSNVNVRSNSGKTALHLLSLQEQNETTQLIAQMLAENNASTEIRDANGLTPLDYEKIY